MRGPTRTNRAEKARVRDIANGAAGWVGCPDEDDVEELCNAMELAGLKTLADKLTPAEEAWPSPKLLFPAQLEHL